jgi:hypothetical protein
MSKLKNLERKLEELQKDNAEIGAYSAYGEVMQGLLDEIRNLSEENSELKSSLHTPKNLKIEGDLFNSSKNPTSKDNKGGVVDSLKKPTGRDIEEMLLTDEFPSIEGMLQLPSKGYFGEVLIDVLDGRHLVSDATVRLGLDLGMTEGVKYAKFDNGTYRSIMPTGIVYFEVETDKDFECDLFLLDKSAKYLVDLQGEAPSPNDELQITIIDKTHCREKYCFYDDDNAYLVEAQENNRAEVFLPRQPYTFVRLKDPMVWCDLQIVDSPVSDIAIVFHNNGTCRIDYHLEDDYRLLSEIRYLGEVK